jgi:parallel beta-helix repeat protein
MRNPRGQGNYMTHLVLYTALLLAPVTPLIPQPVPLPITKVIAISQFGAKGDGKTDDTKSFLAAISAAASAGARLELGDSTYLLTGTLRIPKTTKAMSIVGGKGTKLIFAPLAPLDTGILISKDSAVELKSFTINGSNAGLNHAISVIDSTDIRLDHLRIEDIRGTGPLAVAGIILGTDDHVWITNSTLTGVGRGDEKPAFVIWNYYRLHSEHIYIGHNQISGNGASIAVGMFDTEHSVIEENTIDGGNICVEPCRNNGYGILFYQVDRHGLANDVAPKLLDEAIARNHIRDTAGSGIYLQGAADSKITNNTISNSTLQMDDSSLPAAAIALNYADDIQILDNTTEQDGKGGIALATTKDILIEGNQIHNSPHWGIHLRVAQINTTIRNNIIDGAPIGVLVEHDATNTTLENNNLTRVNRATQNNPMH